MKLIFMGSPAFAVPSLKALHAAGHTFAAIYTQPPRPAGRGHRLTPTAVHQTAESLGLGHLVRHPERLRGDALTDVLETPCDAIVVVAYGLLLPKALTDSRICLNIHPSALPRWRGPAPIQHTLLAGESTTDICIMKLDEGMDTGPVYQRIPLTIPPATNAGELHDICANLGAEHLLNVLAQLPTLTPVPQQGEATLAPKITPDMRLLDLTQPATRLHNKVRALAPAPGATAVIKGEVCKILATEVVATTTPASDHDIILPCGQGALRILTLQRAGKKPMSAAEALRGWGNST